MWRKTGWCVLFVMTRIENCLEQCFVTFVIPSNLFTSAARYTSRCRLTIFTTFPSSSYLFIVYGRDNGRQRIKIVMRLRFQKKILYQISPSNFILLKRVQFRNRLLTREGLRDGAYWACSKVFEKMFRSQREMHLTHVGRKRKIQQTFDNRAVETYLLKLTSMWNPVIDESFIKNATEVNETEN